MPELETQCILNTSLELLHINFRKMRQSIEHEMTHLRNQIASGKDTGDAVNRVVKLIALTQKAKQEHRQLVRDLKTRARFWAQYEWEPSTVLFGADPLVSPSTAANESLVAVRRAHDQPVIVLIANYLAERGCYSVALQRLLDSRPDVIKLLDLNIIKEENELVEQFKQQDYNSLLKWCRIHRSSLKRVDSKLELHIQLREYMLLIRQGRTKEALAFGRKAFSKPSPSDYSAIMEATSSLYNADLLKGPPLSQQQQESQPVAGRISPEGIFPSTVLSVTRFSNSDLSESEIITQIRQAVRLVYHRPKQNPLINKVLIGAAALKTRQCSPGTHAVVAESELQPQAVCPLCRSIKLDPLFRAIPFAHHSRSKLEPDLRMFPSGAVISMRSIREKMAEENLDSETCMDPKLYTLARLSDLKTVFAL